jgi:hypothetical protein
LAQQNELQQRINDMEIQAQKGGEALQFID